MEEYANRGEITSRKFPGDDNKYEVRVDSIVQLTGYADITTIDNYIDNAGWYLLDMTTASVKNQTINVDFDTNKVYKFVLILNPDFFFTPSLAGDNNPTVTGLEQKYTFKYSSITALGSHPIRIYDANNVQMEEEFNMDNFTLSFNLTSSRSPYTYRCEFHTSMNGVINILNDTNKIVAKADFIKNETNDDAIARFKPITEFGIVEEGDPDYTFSGIKRFKIVEQNDANAANFPSSNNSTNIFTLDNTNVVTIPLIG